MRNLLAAVLSSVVLLAGCQPGPDSPNTPVSNVANSFVPPQVGAVWTYSRNGRPETFERLPDAPINGRSLLAFRSSDGRQELVNYFLPETGAWVVSTDPLGNRVAGATPQNYQLDWPLTPGKRWSAAFTLDDYGSDTSESLTVDWVVTGQETLDLGFGRIAVLRVVGTSENAVRTNLFAPSLGVYALQEIVRNGQVAFRRSLTGFKAPPPKPVSAGY